MFRPLATLMARRAARLLVIALVVQAGAGLVSAQTAFLSFDTTGQYTNNFNPWNDNAGANGGNYAFAESVSAGVAGGGAVSVFQSTDTSATYKSQGWNFATNGATIIVSTLVLANGQTSGDRTQLGVINSTTNGFNSNANVQFETFRFVPASATSWTLFEQYRSAGVTTTSGTLGTVPVISGHWYKFVVGLTNTSGASGNFNSGCALIDYGTTGVVPGTNAITFSTAQTHTALNIATNTAVWPGLRSFQDAGISAWDNFLVFTTNSAPVFTIGLSNSTIALGSPVTFSALAEGPGAITYAWYTNNTIVSGVSGSTYATTPSNGSLTNVTVIATNSKGSATNQTTISALALMTPIALTGFNSDVMIETGASGPPFAGAAQEFNAGEGTCFYQHGLAGTTYGLPVSGAFNSAIDQTLFQFQPYTANNVLLMSADTGISSGMLSLVTPATYSSISLIANSGNATATSTGALTLTFADGSTFVTNYNAADWFFNSPFALQGVDRINISTGAPQGTGTDPRFYQTTLNLAAIKGTNNQTLVSMTFGQAPGSHATGVYAVSGSATTNRFTLATLTNSPATGIQAGSAVLNGTVVSIGSSAPLITIFYGTNNAGTNAAAWAASVSLGSQSGAFGQAVGNLLPGTTYYFTARAVNSAGISWAAPSQIFLTLAPTGPQIANSAATSIKGTQATLNGQVLSTGGTATTVDLFYGLGDGGTNAGSWANAVSIGAQTGGYSQTIGPLATNTTYYFTARASNSVGVVWASPSLHFTTLATNPPSTLAAVLTYHNDNTRQGLNSNETILTLANVNTNTFGKLFDYAVDGFVYAQPLVAPAVNISGKGTHNVVFVATEHNSVYAFDADSNTGGNASPLWKTSFLGPGVTTVPNGVVGSTDITPEIGITSTPVIDLNSGTLYVEVKTLEQGSNYVHRMHALDIGTGLERTNFGSPALIIYTNYPGVGNGASSGQFADNDGQNPPHVLWNPLREHCRPALTLLNGVVYVAFASHGDTQPYHGWIFGYNATNMTTTPSAFNVTPNGFEGGIWDGGGAPSVDAQGNLYFQTGNGSFDGGTTVTATNDYSMSILKLATTNGLKLVDYFAPSNAVSLSGSDQDLGSSAPIILPDSAGSAAHPHLVVGGGKTPPVYLVDRDNMGTFHGTSGANQIVQQFNGGAAGDRDITPAFFNNTLYMIDANGQMGAFKLTNGMFNPTPVEAPERFDNKGGATPCISANGTNNGILWAIYNPGGQTPTSPAILKAYNATNLTQKLYASDQLASRDSAGDAVKFIVPTIVNGKVYVGAQYTLSVYGTAQSFVATPTITPNGGFFVSSVTVTLSDTTPGASIFYTLDGTTPTTNSIPYSTPFVLTNSTTVSAGAFKTGSIPSSVVSASFLNTAAAGNGIGLRAAYYSNQLASFNPPASLVRTDAFINFNWQGTSPDPSISPTNFSVRWTGCMQPQYNETYTLYTWSDAGVRLWVNGQLLIDKWTNQPPTVWSAPITLVAQQLYNIQLDYFYQNQGTPLVQLSWSSPSTPQQVIPQSQLYPVTNAPPVVQMTSPTNGTVLTALATATLGANAAAQSNAVASVAFYINGQLYGTFVDPPYALTATGLPAGAYSLTAVATDTSGLAATSAPVNLTVSAGSGLPYGMSNYPPAPAYYNMPQQLPGSLPPLLSQTGVFTNTPNMSVASTLIPYSPNVPLWSDGALKLRYVSIPNSGAPYTPEEQISYGPTGTWAFPSGTVFVKTFELLTNQSDPNSILRLETRLLVRDIAGAVYGVTYKWRPDYSDAELLSTSQTQAVSIITPSGTVTQNWYYPSPSDCLQCHTPVANYVLGLSARQFNGNFTYPNGVTDNQLRTLNRLGLLYPAIDESSIGGIEHLSSLTNLAASLEERSRSYLDANCAQCHQPGGTGPTFDARYDTPLSNQNIINVLAVKGNLGYDNVRIVAPKDVWRSSIYDRMNIVSPTVQMPPLARNVIDANAVQVMGDWINSLSGTPALAPPALVPAGGSYVGLVNVTAVPPTNNVSMYYTLDGSLPTTNSIPYTGPILVASNLTLNVNAWATGYVNSVVGVGSYTILPGVYFISANALANGAFQMTLAGPAGSNYVLLASTNLQQWVAISTNTPLSSPFVLSDPNATNTPMRFYRVQQK